MYTEYVPTFGLNLWVNIRKIFQSHVAALGFFQLPTQKSKEPIEIHSKNPGPTEAWKSKLPRPVSPPPSWRVAARSVVPPGWGFEWCCWGGGKCSVTKSLWCTKHLHLFKDSQKYENWRIMFSFKCQNQSDHGYVFQKRKVGWSIENGQFWALFCQVADVHLHFWGDLLAAHYLSQVFTYRMFVHPPFFPLPAGYRPKTSYLATDPRQCPEIDFCTWSKLMSRFLVVWWFKEHLHKTTKLGMKMDEPPK